ncbi:sugar phosphate isomerase/epimerase [Desulforhabdus sp. TSK]|uniref:sugar phosphate isomerase/epimerase family protein n=1 Tax=Desulforhabdus sp. TSK TaxID=2925014 RepID=UPI001FC7E722|nr:sugar phosphate isomerase/epimerase family protein [Desulforhabdus sp. TSK]GKT06904.1 AP endonuclease [Desulforhabdus sp. TSK]
MELSFSTNAFVRHSVYDAVEKIAAAGYRGVELLADIPHLYADAISAGDLRRLKALLQGKGLQVANVNANTAAGYYGREFWEPLFEPSLAHPDQDRRRWRIDYTRKCIDIARALDSPCVSITSGRMVPGILPEQSLGLLRQSLREIVLYARECGVRLGMEYEPGLLVECYEDLMALLHDLQLPELGANLDLGHSHVLREDPETVIGGLASRIFHIHMEDIRARKHYHLIPGTGDMDFQPLFQILKNNGYSGFITVELYTYPQMPEEAAIMSLRYLRGFLPISKKETQ